MKKRKIQVEYLDSGGEDAAPGVSFYPTGLEGLDPAGKVTAYSNDKIDQQMVVRQQETVDYVGTTMRPPSEPSFMPCKLALGVYNKKKSKMTVMPVFGNQVFRMEPRLHSIDYGKSELVTDFGDDRSANWRSQKRLMAKFGAAKAKKVMRDRESHRVVASELQTAKALDKLAADVRGKAEREGVTRDQVMQAANKNRNLPPHHPEATTGKEAYRFEDICPPVYWSILPTEKLIAAASDNTTEMDLRKSKGFSMFVINRLPTLKSGTAKEIKRKALALSYIANLVLVHKMPDSVFAATDRAGMKSLASKYNLMGDGVVDLVMGTFYNQIPSTGQVKFERSDAKKRLLRQYIFLMALHVDNFFLEPDALDTLRLEMNLQPVAMQKLLTLLGCTVAQVRGDGPHKCYTAGLLKIESDPPKTLLECFPELDTRPKRGGGR